MKLNFTKDEVYADFEDAPVSYQQKLQQDVLALHVRVEAQTTLIEQMEEALRTAQIMFVNIKVKSDKKYAQEIQDALSAVEEWRTNDNT